MDLSFAGLGRNILGVFLEGEYYTVGMDIKVNTMIQITVKSRTDQDASLLSESSQIRVWRKISFSQGILMTKDMGFPALHNEHCFSGE